MFIITLPPCFLGSVVLSNTDVRWGKWYVLSRDLVGVGIFSKSVGVQFMTPTGYAKTETAYVQMASARVYPDFVLED
jgi:hypothetical protein